MIQFTEFKYIVLDYTGMTDDSCAARQISRIRRMRRKPLSNPD